MYMDVLYIASIPTHSDAHKHMQHAELYIYNIMHDRYQLIIINYKLYIYS